MPSQSSIVKALANTTLRIPDLKSLFTNWAPPRLNPLYPDLVPLVADALNGLAAAGHPVQGRLRDDVALLTSLWFPDAEWAGLRALGVYTVWLICWDDAVDANEGDLAADLGRADAWRAETLAVLDRALDASDERAKDETNPDALHSLLLAFGASFAGKSTPAQRARFSTATGHFVQCCADEQRLRLRGTDIPSYAAYMEMRAGTIASGMLSALVEFATQMEMPASVVESGHAGVLRRQTSIMLSLLNDVLSLKKELRTGCVINAVASLLTPGRTLDEVMDEIYGRLSDAVASFDEAAGHLLDSVGDAETKSATSRYIDGQRCIVIGTLEFTLKSPRYNLAELLRKDGSLEIIL